MEKKRVLMLAHVASHIDLFNTRNISILQGLGCQVDVLANFEEGSTTNKERVEEFRKELYKQGINVYHAPIPRSMIAIKQMRNSYRIIKKLERENYYDVIHVHSPIGGVLGRLAFKESRKKGTKIIYTAHGFHFFRGCPLKNWLLFYPIESYCSSFTDILITINKEDYQRSLRMMAARNIIIPGVGIDTSAFRVSGIDRSQKRKTFGLSEDDFVLMSSGELTKRKNHRVIIEAIAKIGNPLIKYVIVGLGEKQEELKSLISALGIQKRVVLTGYRQDIKELLNMSDAFAMPSLQEGLSVSLMEAMAAGLPVVASRIRGNVDLIEDGKGGYLYNPHDINGFAEGIRLLFENRFNSNIGLSNVEIIKDYDSKVVDSMMVNIYKSALI